MSGIEWIPREGMEFSSTEEAWDFWLKYGGKVGFHVRRDYHNRSPVDGKTTSRAYVCGNEGVRVKSKRDDEIKRRRQETRTDCRVRMVLKLDRNSDKYKVIEFVSQHITFSKCHKLVILYLLNEKYVFF